MIIIVDYNAGNIKSIQNMLKKIGVKSLISNANEDIEQADKLILPGVGHFDYGMKNLLSSGIVETLNKKVLEQRTPILGICLGAQLLGMNSEEGTMKGLNWIPMNVVKFKKEHLPPSFKIPHMGWNTVQLAKQSKLFEGLQYNSRFYFVHSYHMQPLNEQDALTFTNYGYSFVSSVEKDNIFGVQFHPEKSHKFGMKLLENFAKL